MEEIVSQNYEINNDEKRGYYMKSNREIKSNVKVLKEEPYEIIFDKSRCRTCSKVCNEIKEKNNEENIKIKSCSKECENKLSKLTSENEIINEINNLELKLSIKFLMKYNLEKDENIKTRIKDLLVHDTTKKKNEFEKLFTENYDFIIKLFENDQYYSNESNELKNDLYNFYLKTKINGVLIKELDLDYKTVVIGKGIYLLTSIFNHSCDPNCEITFDEMKRNLTILSKKQIIKDDELTISYGKIKF
jgi:hypothetical protein